MDGLGAVTLMLVRSAFFRALILGAANVPFVFTLTCKPKLFAEAINSPISGLISGSSPLKLQLEHPAIPKDSMTLQTPWVESSWAPSRWQAQWQQSRSQRQIMI